MDPIEEYMPAQRHARGLATQIADPMRDLRSFERTFRIGQIDASGTDFTAGADKPVLTVEGRTMRCVANPGWLPEPGDLVIFIENVGDPIAVWALDPPAQGVWARLRSTGTQTNISSGSWTDVTFSASAQSGTELVANASTEHIEWPSHKGANGRYTVSCAVSFNNDGASSNGWRRVRASDSSANYVVWDSRTEDATNLSTILAPATTSVGLTEAGTEWLKLAVYASSHSGAMDLEATANTSTLAVSRIGF